MGRRCVHQTLAVIGITVFAVGCPKDTTQPITVASASQHEPVIVGAEEPFVQETAYVPPHETNAAYDGVVESEIETFVTPEEIMWVPPADAGMSSVSIRNPMGVVSQYEFRPGEAPYVDAGGLSDGLYVYEVTVDPALDASTVALMNEVADDPSLRESVVEQLVDEGYLPKDPVAQSGTFTVADGVILPGDTLMKAMVGASDQDVQYFTKDQVILDDLIVDGSACIGFDCVNGESFGFDTLRLKENNLRIKFQDTSSTASFPSNDWQLTANDSANGGLNKFSIDDIDGGRTPFTLEAGAPSHSLYVDSSGRVGFGTSNPVVDIHVKSGNTPTLRLEQDGSSGFTPQTWDVAGNEANFFIRDATNGSTLPFRIFPGAPTSAISIAASGNVGLGTTSPDADLHVKTSTGLATIKVESTTTSGHETIQFVRPQRTWTVGTRIGGAFAIERDDETAIYVGSINLEVLIAADMNVAGTFTNSSDRNLKDVIEPVDPSQILQQVVDMPISTWNFKKEDASIRHLGPMAQDFMAAFGLGKDERRIAALDADGVSLAAIQGLNSKFTAEIEEKDAMIAEQAQALRALADRVAALEHVLQK